MKLNKATVSKVFWGALSGDAKKCLAIVLFFLLSGPAFSGTDGSLLLVGLAVGVAPGYGSVWV